jgi:hypothetical protein
VTDTLGQPILPSDRREIRRLTVRTIVRIMSVTLFLLVVYFTVPLDTDTDSASVVLLLLGLTGFVIALAHSIRKIVDAPYPQLRGIETLAIAVPFFIVLFAYAYAELSKIDASNFSEPLSKMSALYFTVTVVSTTGFGDIVGTTDTTRAIVTFQMVADLIIIGVVVKLIFGASRIGLERRRAEAAAATEDDADA